MEMPYPVRVIEERWCRRWADAAIGIADLDAVDPDRVFYNLVEFPYPSAGSTRRPCIRYVGVDTYGRYHACGAVRCSNPSASTLLASTPRTTPSKPASTSSTPTERTTARFREQLSQLGACWDWARVVDTSRPEYYR